MAGVSIRPFAEGDLVAVAALVGELGYPTTVDQMRSRLDRIARHPDHATFVAVADGSVVGMVGASVAPAYGKDELTGNLTAMVVTESQQGRGIGARLVGAAEEWVRQRGAKLIVLTSHNRREGAHAFYRHLGYSDTGKRFARDL
jgi:GNAT superfamily N-acetyltransferase